VWIVLLVVTTIGCGRVPEYPQVHQSPRSSSTGYPIKPRPTCTADAMAALSGAPDAIVQAGRRGVVFTCELPEITGHLPLDAAVLEDDAVRVTALLDAGADPNARWTPRGDRFPLQTAVEIRQYGRSDKHRTEIIQLLLDHGADPNQRWCEYESRDHSNPWACVSDEGMTPLLWAAISGDAGLTFQLLEAGADPALEDVVGANALDYASTEAVLFQLLSAARLSVSARGREAIAYLDSREPTSLAPTPWDATALTRAIVSSPGNMWLLSFPPQYQGAHAYYYNPRDVTKPPAGRVTGLLALGADSNRRLTQGGVDWTPLALAITVGDPEVVFALVQRHADVNARWCVPVVLDERARLPSEPGCTRENGTTPLMLAASLGREAVARALLQGSPDYALRDVHGRTALDHARLARHGQVVSVLTAYENVSKEVARTQQAQSGP
jgi:ankyrin repeat protein